MAPKKQLRIIGGTLRSRLITFDPTNDIRPTANRVRETLFNWLSPIILDAHCLDLFAGSGALSIEALSRGAQFVVMNDHSSKILKQLQQTLSQLKIPPDKFLLSNMSLEKDSSVIQASSKIPKQHFDVVFIDPPFGKNLIARSCALLLEKKWIDSHSRIYIESEKELDLNHHLSGLMQKFKILKKGQTSQTAYFLLQLDNHE